jgi:hypothetical protein
MFDLIISWVLIYAIPWCSPYHSYVALHDLTKSVILM